MPQQPLQTWGFDLKLQMPCILGPRRCLHRVQLNLGRGTNQISYLWIKTVIIFIWCTRWRLSCRKFLVFAQLRKITAATVKTWIFDGRIVGDIRWTVIEPGKRGYWKQHTDKQAILACLEGISSRSSVSGPIHGFFFSFRVALWARQHTGYFQCETRASFPTTWNIYNDVDEWPDRPSRHVGQNKACSWHPGEGGNVCTTRNNMWDLQAEISLERHLLWFSCFLHDDQDLVLSTWYHPPLVLAIVSCLLWRLAHLPNVLWRSCWSNSGRGPLFVLEIRG